MRDYKCDYYCFRDDELEMFLAEWWMQMCYHMLTNNCSNECEDEDEEEDGQVVYEHLCLPYGFKIMFSKRAST